MTRNEYNGWTNYETWLANLWADKDGDGERWNEYAKELLDEARDDGEDETKARATASGKLADRIKEEHEEHIEQLDLSGLMADLLNAGSREINWREIAERRVSDAEWEPLDADEDDSEDEDDEDTDEEGENNGAR
jgi:hypothetical protein